MSDLEKIISVQELGNTICGWHQDTVARVQHEINVPDDVIIEVKFQSGESRDLTPEEKVIFIEGMRHVFDHFNTLPIHAVEVPTETPVSADT